MPWKEIWKFDCSTEHTIILCQQEMRSTQETHAKQDLYVQEGETLYTIE